MEDQPTGTLAAPNTPPEKKPASGALEPGMSKPITNTTIDRNRKDEANQRAERAQETEEDVQTVNKDGTPKSLKAKLKDPVLCRITKAGHGQVFTGDPGSPTAAFEKGDIIELERENAEELERRHFVEVED